ncbi:MAG: peptide-binding protein [Desulfobulbus sp.]|nr:MAG: peptide-binding protein [Desulfobulbus sp.]
MNRLSPHIRRLFLALFFLLTVMAWNSQAEMLSITGNEINMRSGPGTNYRVLWTLGQGFPLKVLKSSGDWYRVSDFEGTIGWVHRSVVGKTPHMIVKTNKNTKKQINIRSGPGTNFKVVAKAHYGVVLKTLEQKSGWVKVEHEQGVTGWVHRNLLWGW